MAITDQTRTMLAALEEVTPAQQFLLDTFTTETCQFDTEVVEVDILQGQRKMAPLVNPLSKSKIDPRIDGTTLLIKPPYIKIARPIEPKDLQRRFRGQTPYAPLGMQQKLLALQTMDLADFRDQCNRRQEWMLAKQMTTGAVTLTGEGINATITLPMLATHEIANTSLVANGWDQSGADPLEDLRNIRRVIAKDSGLTANVVIFGATAWKQFAADASVKAWLNIWNLTPGQLNPVAPSIGAQLQGMIEGFNLYTYNEWYIDDVTGEEDPMVPDKKIVVASTAMRTVRLYGAIMDLESLEPVEFFPKTWRENDPSVHYVQGQSAPFPHPIQVNGFAYAQVIA